MLLRCSINLYIVGFFDCIIVVLWKFFFEGEVSLLWNDWSFFFLYGYVFCIIVVRFGGVSECK